MGLKDPEKGEGQEDGTTRTESTYYQSDNEKGIEEGAIGIPDLDHDEVEQMDAGHLDDLVRQHVSLSFAPNLFLSSQPSRQ
jgi:hypothetical protein